MARFRGEGRNGSQSKNLLRGKGDADKRSTRDDLKQVNGVGTEIKKAVVHAHTAKLQNLGADGGEFCFRRSTRSDEQVLLRETQGIQADKGLAVNFSVRCVGQSGHERPTTRQR